MSIWIDIGKGRKYCVRISEPVNRLQDPWDDLAQAVILQAVKDYRKVLKALVRRPDSLALKKEKKQCEAFFRSVWFGVLSGTNPDFILEELRKEVAG